MFNHALALALLLVSFTASALPTRAPEPASTHGMLVFGTSKIYLSHLPMYHRPHDRQVIFEVELDGPGAAAYLTSKQTSAETVYTIEPESFVLGDMIDDPTSFKADLYRGHFERGGTKIADGVTVKITKVVAAWRLTATATRPANGSFFMIGNADEQFMLHTITAKPNFDQVMAVAARPELVALLAQQPMVPVTINGASDTLPAPEKPLVIESPQGRSTVTVKSSCYVEFDDLK